MNNKKLPTKELLKCLSDFEETCYGYLNEVECLCTYVSDYNNKIDNSNGPINLVEFRKWLRESKKELNTHGRLLDKLQILCDNIPNILKVK